MRVRRRRNARRHTVHGRDARRRSDRNVFGPKVSIAVTHGGDTIPQQDFPFLAQAALDGRLDLARFVSRTLPLEDVPDALEHLGHGGDIRAVALL